MRLSTTGIVDHFAKVDQKLLWFSVLSTRVIHRGSVRDYLLHIMQHLTLGETDFLRVVNVYSPLIVWIDKPRSNDLQIIFTCIFLLPHRTP